MQLFCTLNLNFYSYNFLQDLGIRQVWTFILIIFYYLIIQVTLIYTQNSYLQKNHKNYLKNTLLNGDMFLVGGVMLESIIIGTGVTNQNRHFFLLALDQGLLAL